MLSVFVRTEFRWGISDFSQIHKCENGSKRLKKWVSNKGIETKRWGDRSVCQSLGCLISNGLIIANALLQPPLKNSHPDKLQYHYPYCVQICMHACESMPIADALIEMLDLAP